MYAVNGKVVVHKVMKDFNKLYKLYKEANKLNTNIVLHFRIATSGGINDYNLHPFKISDDAWFCHNGILDIQVPRESKENDTQIYNNGILKQLPKEFYKDAGIMQLIRFSIGNGNKFVFLDKLGEYYILNEEAGVWDGECWYSNTSYKSARASTYTTYNWKRNTKKYDIVDDNDDWDTTSTKVKEETYPCEDCGFSCDVKDLRYSMEFRASLCEYCYEFNTTPF
jgi:predicted glutamine amidotransferase